MNINVSELNELIKNLIGNKGEQILETLSAIEALISSGNFQNLKHDVNELKEVANFFGNQLTNKQKVVLSAIREETEYLSAALKNKNAEIEVDYATLINHLKEEIEKQKEEILDLKNEEKASKGLLEKYIRLNDEILDKNEKGTSKKKLFYNAIVFICIVFITAHTIYLIFR